MKYQAPDVKVVEFDVEGRIMDGYNDGDVFTFPPEVYSQYSDAGVAENY